MWKWSASGISIFSCGVFADNSAPSHCAMFRQASFPKGGPSLATCLLRQKGGGASSVEIPLKEL